MKTKIGWDDFNNGNNGVGGDGKDTVARENIVVLNNEVDAIKENIEKIENEKHEHNNKNVLDTITQDKINEWDSKVDGDSSENYNDFFILKQSDNILDATLCISGSKYNTANGDILSSASYSRYPQFIEIDKTKSTIYIVRKDKNTGGILLMNPTGTDIFFYDDTMTYTSNLRNTNTISIEDIEEKATYFKFHVASSVLETYDIGVYYDRIPTEWSEYSNYYSLSDNVKLDTTINKTIIDCWGDSLTNGVGGNGTSYCAFLKELLGDSYTVNKYGNGGEGSLSVASRQGGYDIYLKPFTLHSSNTTAIEIYNNDNMLLNITNIHGINPCYVGDIQCEFSISNNTYYLKQINGTENIVFDRPIKLKTRGSIATVRNINIIWCGTNNLASNGYTIEDTANAIQCMIDNLEHNYYIVVGLTAKAYHEDIIEKNDYLNKKFGKRFLDIRRYILDFGLEDMGITPTNEDNTTISNGEMPPSLLSDDVHFNEKGYELIANLIYKKGIDLGYW